jgi:hypothetical protein
MDLSGFDIFDVPQTAGKARQTEAAKPAPECFIEAHAARLTHWVQCGDLHQCYVEFCKAGRFTPVAVNRFYNELEPYGVAKKPGHGGRTYLKFSDAGMARWQRFLGNDDGVPGEYGSEFVDSQ